MKKASLLCVVLCCALIGFAQNSFRALVLDSSARTPLAGATVRIESLKRTALSNDSGLVVLTDLPAGLFEFLFTYSGAGEQRLSVTLPDTSLHILYLNRTEETLGEVIISTTRTDSRIENSPLKVEVLGREEMDEENTIKPGNIASILSDVSGIQIQQSSPVSGNANVRIQGLEGRYTQILRDGMPLFEGFSSGFGVLTIPPLDLRQIELVKGSASTLYGGGAIGGLINLLSKRPTAAQEAVLTLNQTTLKESNANAFLSKRYKSVGYSLFAGYTRQGAVDVNKDGLTDVSKQNTFIAHPRLFFYPSSKTTIIAGYTGTFSNNLGGDLTVVNGTKNSQHQYFERNKTARNTGEFILEQSLAHGARLTVKSTVSGFDRRIETNTHNFNGRQLNYYAEASAFVPHESWNVVAGVNLTGDAFRKKPSDPVLLQDFSNNTLGAFAQYTRHFGETTVLEAGLRADHHNDYGNFVLPRLALFHRFNQAWGSRLGFGMGYKTPNALAPQNVEYEIQNIQPIAAGVKAETSYGFNAEVNYKKEWGEENSLFINQALFLTQLQNPLVANESGNGLVSFYNAAKPVVSKGFDTYVQLNLSGWEIYAGYTFTLARRNYLPANNFVPLTPKNRTAFTLVKEIGEAWRFGLEGSYTGRQYRDGNSRTPGYLFMAAMVERKFGHHLSLVLNGENLFDYRQSNYEALFTGPITAPVFRPLWAPIDGRVLNLSLRIRH